MAISPDGRTAVTSNFGEGTLSVIDVATRTVTRTQPVLGGAGAAQVTILFSPDGERLYVAQTAPGVIVEVDLAEGELLGMLGAGTGSDGLAISPVDVTRRLRPGRQPD